MRTLLLLAAIVPVLLLLFQHRLIYFPRPYESGELSRLPREVRRISYRTSEGNQVAFFLPAQSPSSPPRERIWVVFPGNAMRALDWLGIVEGAPNRHDGFLLIDYPGYGECQGSASPKAIEDSSVAAFTEWMKTRDATSPPPRIGVLGVSLGAAAGLQFATHHPIDKIILIAPFVTTLQEAKRVVGIPLCYLLRHRFDNRARLAELAAWPAPPKVRIFHGTDDSTIPLSRSQSLQAAFPQMVELEEVDGADHNSVIDQALDRIHQAMID